MYAAKETGATGSRSSAATAMGRRARARLSWSTYPRGARARRLRALRAADLDLATGRVDRSELLVRMLDADGRPIPPGRVPRRRRALRPDPGARPLGLDRAIELLAERQARGRRPLGLEVNLSGVSITDATLVAFIAAEVALRADRPHLPDLRGHGDRRHREHRAGAQFRRPPGRAGLPLRARRLRLGLRLVLLPQAPPVGLRQDRRRLHQDLPRSRTDQLTVQAIVQIARAWARRRSPSSSTTRRRWTLLREYGVDFAQGYHLGRPAPAPLDS